MGSREDYEAAIGAIITNFNDVEAYLIDLIGTLIGDDAKGQVIGWAIGFNQKVRVIAGLANLDKTKMSEVARGQLMAMLREAERLSDEVRNQVAHAELWEDAFRGNAVHFRKPKVNPRKGFVPWHPEWTVEMLKGFALEIQKVATDLQAFYSSVWREPPTQSPQNTTP